MDFSLPQEYVLLQEMFQKFAENEVRPVAKEMDEKELFSMELLQKLKDNKLLGIPYPKEYGGAGHDVLAYALLIEELSKCCGSTGVTVSVHTSLCANPIYEWDRRAKTEIFSASGKRRKNRGFWPYRT